MQIPLNHQQLLTRTPTQPLESSSMKPVVPVVSSQVALKPDVKKVHREFFNLSKLIFLIHCLLKRLTFFFYIFAVPSSHCGVVKEFGEQQRPTDSAGEHSSTSE